MKKLVFIMPLMAVSLLASCGGGDNPGPEPEEDVKFTATTPVTLDKTKTKANISLDWTPTNHSIECSDFIFTLKNQASVASTIVEGELGSRPLNLAITFDAPLDIGDEGDLKFHYNDKTAKKEGDGEIKGINVKRALEDCTWKEINEISKSGKAKETFKVGDTKTVEVNNKNHTVRIIGFNHDALKSDKTKTAGITFEFANVITNSDGNADTIYWNNKGSTSSTNYKYSESTLNDYLNVDANCIFNKLPDDLKADGIIKEVYKLVAEGSSYGLNDKYTTKLFPLSYREITAKGTSSYAKNEGFPYPFYTGEGYDTNGNRIKRKVGDSGDIGEFYWLRSPSTYSSRDAWGCGYTGVLNDYVVFNHAFAAAPAFCI